MKVSNFVISSIVAISAAGGLGLAYAQSSNSELQPGTSAPTRQGATPAPGTMDQSPRSTMSQDSSSTMDQDSTGSTGTPRSGSTYNEQVPRADRN